MKTCAMFTCDNYDERFLGNCRILQGTTTCGLYTEQRNRIATTPYIHALERSNEKLTKFLGMAREEIDMLHEEINTMSRQIAEVQRILNG